MNKLNTRIDEVIAKITSNNTDPSQEVLDLIDTLEELSTELAQVKKDKTKTVQTPVFAFPDMSVLSNKLDLLTKTILRSSILSTEESKKITTAIEAIKLDIPAPQVNVEVPEIKIPQIKVPPINVPEQKVDFPKEMSIKKPNWLPSFPSLDSITSVLTAIKEGITGIKLPKAAKDAIAVRLSDGDKFYKAIGGIGASAIAAFPFKKADATNQAALTDDDGRVKIVVSDSAGRDVDISPVGSDNVTNTKNRFPTSAHLSALQYPFVRTLAGTRTLVP